MKLYFLGGAREVGKSSILVEEKDLKLVLDVGMKTHDHNELPLHPLGADAAVLSHAHLDHSGGTAALYRHYNIPTFCTPPTIPVMNLLLEDAIKVAQKRGKDPHFSGKELNKLNHNLIPLPYNREYDFFEGTTLKFLDAGHVIGSSQIFLHTSSGKNVLYTGDLKIEETRMHKGAEKPGEKVDVLVIESTYADRDHLPRKDLEKMLCDGIKEAIEQGLVAVVPAFAVGRTQEVIEILHAHRVHERIFLAGMGKDVSRIYGEFHSYIKNPRSFSEAYSLVKHVGGRNERKKLVERPCVIIATAGMLEGGPALDFIDRLNKTGKGAIFLTGFQVKGTNGKRLLEEGRLKDKGVSKKIVLPVELINLSAHEGRKGLFDYVKQLNPEKVFCVHGDQENCDRFARELREQGFQAHSPKIGEKFEVK